MKRVACFLAVLCFASSFAQPPDFGGKTQIEKMKAFDFLVGEWKGKGWYDAGGRKIDVKCSEKVIRKAGGTVLAIEGYHTMEAGGREIPIHDAYAVITWTEKAGYRFKAHLSSGLQNEFDIKVQDKGYVWFNEWPGMGKVRYTMTLTPAGEWKEIGERDAEGKWVQFFEMVLKK